MQRPGGRNQLGGSKTEEGQREGSEERGFGVIGGEVPEVGRGQIARGPKEAMERHSFPRLQQLRMRRSERAVRAASVSCPGG